MCMLLIRLEHGEVLIPAIKECILRCRYGRGNEWTIHLLDGLI